MKVEVQSDESSSLLRHVTTTVPGPLISETRGQRVVDAGASGQDDDGTHYQMDTDVVHQKLGPVQLVSAPKKLGQWHATAIAGNDITSSSLYVVGALAGTAGQMAPVCSLLIVLVLYAFRRIYAEVGTAMPLNGGTYNLLLNTSSKLFASLAACLTILSYIATAIVNATTACAYLSNLFPVGELNLYVATVAVLYVFALLTFWGMRESAVVALGVFALHMSTMAVLILASIWYMIHHQHVLASNFESPPELGYNAALFYGFSVAFIGVTGFESSSNYIESQSAGVFQKTLRNMWVCVLLLNPLLSFCSLGVLSKQDLAVKPSGKDDNKDALARMAFMTLGQWFHLWVSFDAFLVLGGSVLTSYIAVYGLIQRMAMERCFPQAVISQNPWRQTNHWIVVLFFVVTVSLFLVLHGNISSLAGVFTISFLFVMILYAMGNVLLKVKRERLKREVRASWFEVAIGLSASFTALLGTLLRSPESIKYFIFYMLGVILFLMITIKRIWILEAVHYLLSQMEDTCCEWLYRAHGARLQQMLQDGRNQSVMYFSEDLDLEVLHRVAAYVMENEDAGSLKVVHCFDDWGEPQNQKHKHNLQMLDKLYPKLRIDLVLVHGEFSPELVQQLSDFYSIPKNFMFIACPGDKFPHDIAALGGVRMVTY